MLGGGQAHWSLLLVQDQHGTDVLRLGCELSSSQPPWSLQGRRWFRSARGWNTTCRVLRAPAEGLSSQSCGYSQDILGFLSPSLEKMLLLCAAQRRKEIVQSNLEEVRAALCSSSRGHETPLSLSHQLSRNADTRHGFPSRYTV